MAKYDVSLLNAEGCAFDNGLFDTMDEIKEWGSGRGACKALIEDITISPDDPEFFQKQPSPMWFDKNGKFSHQSEFPIKE